ncbi:MAG: ABC transporter permease [Verrucomicrobia bacterium]|nr:ABC transporter permease [Verrucomicrobiota bacterium]MBS0636874.1 ABC transporter permease [Verrucomicrobiota bacterium]
MLQSIFTFLLRRLGISVLTLFAIATATFILMHLVPGDPFAEESITAPPETLRAIKHYYGLDDPLHLQYSRYILQVFTFDFGPSLKYPSQTVNQIIFGSLPISATLGLEALCFAIPFGILFGAFSALNSRGYSNVALTSCAVLGVSVPTFVLAAALQFVFAFYFQIFPVARWGTFAHTVLPALALAVGPACYIARLLRVNMLEVFTKEYVQVARLKGLSEPRVIFVHVLKNAIIPILTYLGPVTTNVLVGSFAVERVFGIPGLGSWFVNSVINRDFPVIGGLTLFYSILLIFNHTVIDLLAALLNPEIKRELKMNKVAKATAT